MSERKNAAKDILKIVLSNLISLTVGVMLGFVIPKITSFDDYGYYKTFSLYYVYAGLLHFGIVDGVYFFLSGKKETEVNLQQMHSIFLFLVILELLISSVGILVSFFATSNEKLFFVFVFVFVYSFFVNVKYMLSYICQATKKFTFTSVAESGKDLFLIACVSLLYFFNKTQDSFAVNYLYLCGIEVGALILNTVLYIVKLRRIIFSNGQSLQETKRDLVLFVKLGFPLMIANLTSSLIMTVDKQIVSIFYPVGDSNVFSVFSFSYSVLSLITAITSAVSTVLFPYMKGKDQNFLIRIFPSMNSFLLSFVSLACCSFFFLDWFLSSFLSKYSGSIIYLRVIFPGLLACSSITVLMHTYYKAFNKEIVYFWQSIIILCLAIVTDLLSYYFLILPLSQTTPVLLTFASDFTIFVWYIVCEGFLCKSYKIKHWKNDLFLLSSIAVFVLVSFFFSKWWGFLIYLFSILFLIFLFFNQEIKMFLSARRKTTAGKQ